MFVYNVLRSDVFVNDYHDSGIGCKVLPAKILSSKIQNQMNDSLLAEFRTN